MKGKVSFERRRRRIEHARFDACDLRETLFLPNFAAAAAAFQFEI